MNSVRLPFRALAAASLAAMLGACTSVPLSTQISKPIWDPTSAPAAIPVPKAPPNYKAALADSEVPPVPSPPTEAAVAQASVPQPSSPQMLVPEAFNTVPHGSVFVPLKAAAVAASGTEHPLPPMPDGGARSRAMPPVSYPVAVYGEQEAAHGALPPAVDAGHIAAEVAKFESMKRKRHPASHGTRHGQVSVAQPRTGSGSRHPSTTAHTHVTAQSSRAPTRGTHTTPGRHSTTHGHGQTQPAKHSGKAKPVHHPASQQ